MTTTKKAKKTATKASPVPKAIAQQPAETVLDAAAASAAPGEAPEIEPQPTLLEPEPLAEEEVAAADHIDNWRTIYELADARALPERAADQCVPGPLANERQIQAFKDHDGRTMAIGMASDETMAKFEVRQ